MDKSQIKISVKAYVFYELWLNKWHELFPGRNPTNEEKNEAKRICRKVAYLRYRDQNM